MITEVTDVAVAENTTVYYCQIDKYRDRYEYNEKTGKPQMTVEAGEGYTELLSWLDEYLADYTVTDEAKNKIEVGEKRIGAPTIIQVKNGEPVAKWQLDSVEGIEYPDNKYDGWDTAIKKKSRNPCMLSLRRFEPWTNPRLSVHFFCELAVLGLCDYCANQLCDYWDV